MKKYKVGICGFLDRKAAGENGQTLRTVTVCKELERFYGTENVCSISSHIWKKRPFKFAFQIMSMARECENIIIFPDRNGISVILPMFYILRKLFHYKMYYNVVGAWLAEFLEEHGMIRKMVSKLNCVFVETNTLYNALRKVGITNTIIFKNFKQLHCADKAIVMQTFSTPYRLCFFSRVTPKKGIEDAIWAVLKVNEEFVKYTFDIYGPVDTTYAQDFSTLCSSLPSEIDYKGVVDAFSSVETIENYYLQLFPTHYETEGIPGSIVDSFFAGVPVIASEWNSCRDVVEDGKTGFIYRFSSREALADTLERAYDHPELIQYMRECCLETAKEYSPDEAIKVVVDEISR